MIRLLKYSALVTAAAFIWMGVGAVGARAAAQSQSPYPNSNPTDRTNPPRTNTPRTNTDNTDKTNTDRTNTDKTNSSTAATSDSEFAKTVAEGNAAEVKLGKLAEEKGTSQEVKDFARRMVDDHTKAGKDLKSAATTGNVSVAVPEQLNAKDQATYDQLSKLSGAAFDRAYVRDMVKDHTTDVAAFRHEVQSGKDPSIKAFASQTLPTLEEHLKQARDLMHNVSKTSGPNKG